MFAWQLLGLPVVSDPSNSETLCWWGWRNCTAESRAAVTPQFPTRDKGVVTSPRSLPGLSTYRLTRVSSPGQDSALHQRQRASRFPAKPADQAAGDLIFQSGRSPSSFTHVPTLESVIPTRHLPHSELARLRLAAAAALDRCSASSILHSSTCSGADDQRKPGQERCSCGLDFLAPPHPATRARGSLRS